MKFGPPVALILAEANLFVVNNNTITPGIGTIMRNSRSNAPLTQRGRGGEMGSGRGVSQEIATRTASVEYSSAADRAGSTKPTAPIAKKEEVTAPPPEASPTGVKKLMDALSALGISTAGLDINYTEEAIAYPGGQYVNKLINVTSNGKTEHFSADLTAKNPLVTAYEMQSYFGIRPT